MKWPKKLTKAEMITLRKEWKISGGYSEQWKDVISFNVEEKWQVFYKWDRQALAWRPWAMRSD